MVTRMANTQLSDKPWLDILPPPVPVDNSLLVFVISTGIICGVLATLYLFWQARPKQKALRHLKKLQQQTNSTEFDGKHCLFEIHRLLCQGFQQHQLAQLKPANHQQDWQVFYRQLVQQQYQAATPAKADTQNLLTTASQLLRDIRT